MRVEQRIHQSAFAQHDPVGELGEPARRARRTARARRALRARSASARALAAGEPEQRHERRLALRGVLAGGLAERRGRALDVEHVVDDLEREPGRARVGVERRGFAGGERPAAARRPAAPPRGSARRSSSGASSRAPAASSVAPTRVEVDRLPARHAARAGGVGEQRAGAAGIGAARPAPARRTPAPAARRRRAAPSPRRTRRGRSACRAAARRRPCTAGRRGPANRRGSARPRRRRASTRPGSAPASSPAA